MTKKEPQQGVGRVFWVTFSIVLIVVLPWLWGKLVADIDGTLGLIILSGLGSLAVAILCGVFAEAISSALQLAKAGELRWKHAGIGAFILAICIFCAAPLVRSIPEGIMNRLAPLIVFGSGCFSLGCHVGARKRVAREHNNRLNPISGSSIKLPEKD